MENLLKRLRDDKLILKNKRMLLLFGGSIFIGLFVIFLTKESPAETVIVESETKQIGEKTQNSTAFHPVPRADDTRMRDPFAAPKKAQEKIEKTKVKKEPESSNSSYTRKNPVTMSGKTPVLTGIIGSENRFIAIIEYDGESKQCLQGSVVGVYSVRAIDEFRVILNGPNGDVVLTVGR